MPRKKVALLFAFTVLIAIAAFLVLPRDRPASLANSKFDQIEPGMTRQQIWQLMEDTAEADCSPGNSLDTWQFRDRFVIIVEFEPDYSVEPGTIDERDPEGENWKVTEVSLLNFSKPNPIQHFLTRFGLWSKSPHRSKP